MKNKREVIALLREISGKKRITEAMRLRTDLGFDSLEMVRLMIALEERFEIELDESDMNPAYLSSVGDILELVGKYTDRPVKKEGEK